MTVAAPAPKLRFGLARWAAGMVGSAVITAAVLPELLRQMQEPLPAPVWLLSLAGLLQSGLILALAVWAGVGLSPSLGLRAPAFEAAVTGSPIGPVLRSQLRSGLAGGILGGILLVVAFRYAPGPVAELQDRFVIPIVARVLYGGITEEILLRWGLMTVLVWLAWRVLQHRQGAVRPGLVWLAISVSALLFAAGHLPAAAVLLGTLDLPVVAFVMGANTVIGMLFGYLYWRHGLESAMIAHALAHVVNFVVNL